MLLEILSKGEKRSQRIKIVIQPKSVVIRRSELKKTEKTHRGYGMSDTTKVEQQQLFQAISKVAED